jgi:hypothetical protein
MAAAYRLERSPSVRKLRLSLAGDCAEASSITAYRNGLPMCGT